MDYVYDTIVLCGEEDGSVSEDGIIDEAVQNIRQAFKYWVELGVVGMKGKWVEKIVRQDGEEVFFSVKGDEGGGSSEHGSAETK